MTKQQHEEILVQVREHGPRLYAEGKSVNEIAKIFGCSFTKVRINLVAFGVKMRPFTTVGLHPNLGLHLSEETKCKLSEWHRGRKLSPEHREKVIKTLQNGKLDKHPSWRGGITNHGGYVCIKKPEHPKAYSNGYVKRAVLVAELKIGRSLERNEVTHHINGVKDDDRPENIEVLSASAHNSITAKERWISGELRDIHARRRKE